MPGGMHPEDIVMTITDLPRLSFLSFLPHPHHPKMCYHEYPIWICPTCGAPSSFVKDWWLLEVEPKPTSSMRLLRVARYTRCHVPSCAVENKLDSLHPEHVPDQPIGPADCPCGSDSDPTNAHARALIDSDAYVVSPGEYYHLSSGPPWYARWRKRFEEDEKAMVLYCKKGARGMGHDALLKAPECPASMRLTKTERVTGWLFGEERTMGEVKKAVRDAKRELGYSCWLGFH
ncbi:hypothetical protein GE09DRAFT_1212530 [Coniochaeta sp. 2T2.1]|nr:hypothetical protein GE09DRAFT_1212530 [Coniochaeta sp. 2T2.1]